MRAVLFQLLCFARGNVCAENKHIPVCENSSSIACNGVQINFQNIIKRTNKQSNFETDKYKIVNRKCQIFLYTHNTQHIKMCKRTFAICTTAKALPSMYN